MLNDIYLRGVYKLLLAMLFVGAVIPIASFATQDSGAGDPDMQHVCTYPKAQPSENSSCTAEAVAYAAALTTLQDAQRAANEAYRRWYECEYRGGYGGKPVVEIPSSEFSVLVRD